MRIAIGSDHAGYSLKAAIIEILQEQGIKIDDLGCNSEQSCDYPDHGHAVARAIQAKTVDFGILVCSTGIGISISANRHVGVRAALCRDCDDAALTRAHNDANVIVFGARTTGPLEAQAMLKVFLGTPFSAEDRHQRRIDKIEL